MRWIVILFILAFALTYLSLLGYLLFQWTEQGLRKLASDPQSISPDPVRGKTGDPVDAM